MDKTNLLRILIILITNKSSLITVFTYINSINKPNFNPIDFYKITQESGVFGVGYDTECKIAKFWAANDWLSWNIFLSDVKSQKDESTINIIIKFSNQLLDFLKIEPKQSIIKKQPSNHIYSIFNNIGKSIRL